MKRISFALLGGLIFVNSAIAQLSIDQRGKATQGIQTEGLTMAHPSLSKGAKVMVANTATGKEVEVTVVDRITPSQERIADLSQGVWRELGLTPDTEIRIFTKSVARARPTPSPMLAAAEPSQVPAQAAASPPESAQASADAGASARGNPASAPFGDFRRDDTPYVVTINNNNNNNNIPQPSERTVIRTGPDTEFLAWLTAMAMDARNAREAREARDVREAREIRENRDARYARELREAGEARAAREKVTYETETRFVESDRTVTVHFQTAPVESTHSIQPVPVKAAIIPVSAPVSARPNPAPVPPEEIMIVPGLPDETNGKIYRLQVGSYSDQGASSKAAELIKSAGFDVQLEYTGRSYRVLAVSISSNYVYSAITRLGSLGFDTIWIRE
jgi:antitoxin component of RelBE/YafQ-DinJ toxin-antitoxin module